MDVENIFDRELAAGGAAYERVLDFENQLKGTYESLPKNENGLLDHQTVRYILHRLFVKRNGWYVKGLEPGGDVFHTEGDSQWSWVPSALVDIVESRKNRIGLHELAVLGAAFEDVARKEVNSTMKAIFAKMGILPTAQLPYEQLRQAIDMYMVFFLGSGIWKIDVDMVSDFAQKHSYWNATQSWFRGVERSHVTTPDGSRMTSFGFNDVSKIAQDLGAQYSSFNGAECSKLKMAMLNMWSQGNTTGRIRLADFYKLGLDSEWALTEKAEYLRTVGALDESTKDMPMVIVPNYLSARPNCVQSTGLYAVCCRNECEGLMDQLERNLSSSTGTPEQIASLISTLKSDTVAAPRLTREQLERLDDMAVLHGGKVIIHGRLFAQWMHHAFPGECPFPHEAGTSDPVTPNEWLDRDLEASEDERRQVVDESSDFLVDDHADIVLPWTKKEELLGAKYVNVTDAAASLAFELSGESKSRVLEFRKALQASWAAWPKDSKGFLELQTARYVLHRLFVQRHSWFLKGLEPGGDVWHKNTNKQKLKDWVPVYLLNLLEERAGHRGIDLNDLAAIGAAIEDLVHKEATGTLQEVYAAMGLPNQTNRLQLHSALSVYMVLYLGNGEWTLDNGAALSGEFARKHDYWNATEVWFRGVEDRHLGNAEGSVDFASALQIAKDVGAGYGAYNDAECQKLKLAMVHAWGKGPTTGRIRLVDFYRLGLETEWSLSEKAGYLRALGALDESNASAPMVIIPNYLSAQPNCLQATSLYAVCCRNECEDLLGELERNIAAPTATPARIMSFVGSLASATVVAPRVLPQEMQRRLEDVAALHGGEVNLHGRLFAQWMHHAFPSECPYPHEAGTSDPVTPDEWAEDIEASEEERRQHVDSDSCGPDQAAAEWTVELPWTPAEELLSTEATMKIQSVSATATWRQSACRTLGLMVIFIGIALVTKVLPRQERQKYVAFANYYSRQLLLSALLVVLFTFNLVNRFMIVLLLGCGIAIKLVFKSWGAPVKGLEKEKCCV